MKSPFTTVRHAGADRYPPPVRHTGEGRYPGICRPRMGHKMSSPNGLVGDPVFIHFLDSRQEHAGMTTGF